MPATIRVPAGYRQQATLDLSKSKTAMVGAIVLGIVLLFAVGWLLVEFTRNVRPAALEGIGFHDILIIAPDGQVSVEFPIGEAIVAFLLVITVHELVHGLFFWWFSGQRPAFGIKGLLVYVAAPPDVYFPRNQYIAVGIAPLVLLTLVGLLLLLVVPVAAISILSLFVAFNAAGAAGDLVMVARLLAYPPDTLMQDSDTGVIVYGPEVSQRKASPGSN